MITSTQAVLCPLVSLLGLDHFSNGCKVHWLHAKAQLDRWKKVWALEMRFNATQPPCTGEQVILLVPSVGIRWHTTVGQFKCCWGMPHLSKWLKCAPSVTLAAFHDQDFPEMWGNVDQFRPSHTGNWRWTLRLDTSPFPQALSLSPFPLTANCHLTLNSSSHQIYLEQLQEPPQEMQP